MTDPILPTPFRLLAQDEVGSTNDEARRLSEKGAAGDLLVVSARSQTAGRGRRGRTWVSPPGNLHCSVLIAITERLGTAAQLGFVAAIALVDALAQVMPDVGFACKWPNDVLAGHKKVAGMLLEPGAEGWLILGLGVDVVTAPPAEAVSYPAISLADLGFAGTAEDMLTAFCGTFGPWLARWRVEGFAPVRAAWMERARGLGEPVMVRLERETLEGTFAGLDADGALLLDQGAVGTCRVLAGDVFFPETKG